jgi:hypothetical protein
MKKLCNDWRGRLLGKSKIHCRPRGCDCDGRRGRCLGHSFYFFNHGEHGGHGGAKHSEYSISPPWFSVFSVVEIKINKVESGQFEKSRFPCKKPTANERQ